MAKITEYPVTTEIANDDVLLVDGTGGTRGLSVSGFSEAVAQHVVNNSQAFAGLVGDVNDLKSDLDALDIDINGGIKTSFSWRDGFYYNFAESDNNTFQRTTLIHLKQGETISFTGGKGTTTVPVNALTRLENGTRSALIYYSGSTAESISYTATVDMDVYVSTLKTQYGNNLTIPVVGEIPDINNRIDSLEDSIPDYVFNQIEPTTLTLDSSGTVAYSFTEGTKYIVKNTGNSTISLSTRTTPSSVSVDTLVIASGFSKEFVASGNASYIACASAFSIEISTDDTLIPFIKNTKHKLANYGTPLPLVRFDFNKVLYDYSSDLTGIDFMANTSGYYTIMQTIYDKFDLLVSAYPEYISRVDAAADVEISYPTYANLDGQASGDYLPTPTYKTYMYKLETNNAFINSSRNPKKKLFLIGATHGNETAGAFNLYLFAKNLCESTDSDYFKLRNSYDVYIVPCLNGYGMCHYVRWNADGVDINRNYPISNWTESGEPFVIGYTGPSAASEFETQLIIALQEKYKFDVAIDHHNYGASNSQFYTEFWYERFNMFANAALADCSSLFISELPDYFGTKYRLFVDITNSTRPNVVLSDTMPCMAKWMYEKNLDFAATIEIGNQINYINGELNPATDIPKYTNDVFKVGEFTLRNQLLYYCGFVLGGVV